MRSVLVLARWDGRALLRDRWFAVLAGAFALLTLAAAAAALSAADIADVSSFDRVGAMLVHLAALLVPLTGLTIGAAWLVQERESGALELLLAQPVDAPTVFTGKALGVARTVVAGLLAGYGAAGTLLALRVGTGRLPPFLWVVGLSALLAPATLAVGFAISAGAPNRSRALGWALLVWLGLVVLSDLGILATALILRLPVTVVLVVGVLNPVSAFRLASILAMSGSSELAGAAGLYAVERLGAGNLTLLLAAVLLLWTVAAFLVGRARFARGYPL